MFWGLLRWTDKRYNMPMKRNLSRMNLAGITLIFLVMACTGLSPAHSAVPLHELFKASEKDITEAEISYTDSPLPPHHANDWQPVQLPHAWPKQAPARTYRGWYRFKLSDTPPTENIGVYFWRFSMNISVYLNDQFVGDGGRFTEPVARNWNRPLLFVLPQSAWRQNNNYLYVKIATYPGWGHLAPIIIDTIDSLQADYDRRFAWQITFSQITFTISLITALVAFILWLSDRSWPVYGLFGLTCLAWSGYSLNLFIQDIPVSAKTWWWFVHSSVDWYGILLVLFGHRLLGLIRPRIDMLAIAFGVLSTTMYFLIPLDVLARVNSTVHLVTVLLAVYLLLASIRECIQQITVENLALTTSLLIIIFFAIHDLGMNAMVTASLWQAQFFWLQFSAPIMMLTMLAVLTRQYTSTLQQKINTEQQISTERERIFSDIHDDIGSRMLSLVYAAETDQQASIAREALKDVRLIVAGATHEPTQIEDFLELLEAEAVERCEHAGIAIHWVNDIADNPEITATSQYHLQRIARELISNSLKHSQGGNISVGCSLSDTARFSLSLSDDGQGDPNLAVAGSGMAGVVRRVNELGGQIIWRNNNPGWSATIELQLTGNV